MIADGSSIQIGDHAATAHIHCRLSLPRRASTKPKREKLEYLTSIRALSKQKRTPLRQWRPRCVMNSRES